MDSDSDGRGGPPAAFPTTRWTEIVGTRTDDPVRRREVLERLLTRYRRPIYSYVRQKVRDRERAEDLTQGFVQEILLGRQLLQRADPARGRFRALLRVALDNYMAGVHRRETGPAHRPRSGLVPLNGDTPEGGLPSLEPTPEQVFDYTWAKTLLDHVLLELEADFQQEGKAVYWEAFRLRVLLPIMENAPRPHLAEIGRRYGIATQKQVANMVITVKRRFQAILRRHLVEQAGSDTDAHEELRDLMACLSRPGCAPIGTEAAT